MHDIPYTTLSPASCCLLPPATQPLLCSLYRTSALPGFVKKLGLLFLCPTRSHTSLISPTRGYYFQKIIMDPRLGSHSDCLRLVSELLAQTRLHPSPVKDEFQKQVERVAPRGAQSRARRGYTYISSVLDKGGLKCSLNTVRAY